MAVSLMIDIDSQGDEVEVSLVDNDYVVIDEHQITVTIPYSVIMDKYNLSLQDMDDISTLEATLQLSGNCYEEDFEDEVIITWEDE